MNNLFLRSFAFVLILTRVAFAQSEDDNKPPTPPFVAAMPDNSTWTVSVANSATSAKLPSGGRAVNQFINIKSGQNREFITFWTDGTKSYLWFWDGYRLEQRPGSTAVLISQIPGGIDLQSADFADLNWLKLTNYVGVENQDGHACYHFKEQVKVKVLHAIFDYSAYIDVKTKRPVAWDVGSNHFELKSVELGNNNDPLVLPDSLAEQLKAYRLAAEAANPYKKQ